MILQCITEIHNCLILQCMCIPESHNYPILQCMCIPESNNYLILQCMCLPESHNYLILQCVPESHNYLILQCAPDRHNQLHLVILSPWLHSRGLQMLAGSSKLHSGPKVPSYTSTMGFLNILNPLQGPRRGPTSASLPKCKRMRLSSPARVRR